MDYALFEEERQEPPQSPEGQGQAQGQGVLNGFFKNQGVHQHHGGVGGGGAGGGGVPGVAASTRIYRVVILMEYAVGDLKIFMKRYEGRGYFFFVFKQVVECDMVTNRKLEKSMRERHRSSPNSEKML